MHISGNCYKIRLTASLLGIKLNLIEYNIHKSETRTQRFTTHVNANGRVPTLQIDSSTFIPESNAACVYLASSPDARRKLIPDDRLEHAQMLQWMFFEQYSHEPNVAVLRNWRAFVGMENLTELQRLQVEGKEKAGKEALDVMERHLGGNGGEERKWFVGDDVSVADVALFAYTHCADTAGFDLAGWPRVKAWVERVSEVDGFTALDD